MSDERMNPEIKKLWIEALRSGKYVQGTGALHKKMTGNMCCLGVLCDIVMQHKPDTWKWHDFGGLELGLVSVEDVRQEDSVSAYPSSSLLVHAGLSAANPMMRVKRGVLIRSDLTDPEEVMDVTLSELNDGHDYTFEQIADLVEEQL